jgi:hypothetical protein
MARNLLDISFRTYASLLFVSASIVLSVGASSSHIGYWNESDVIKNPSTIFGEPRAIRADEFLRGSPGLLGHNSTWSDLERLSPLSAHSVPNDFSFFDFNPVTLIVNILPIEFKLSFISIFFTFLLLLFLPLLFNSININWKFGFCLSLLMILSPSNLWWSNILVIASSQFSVSFYFIVKMFNLTKMKNSLIISLKSILYLFIIFSFLNNGLKTYQLFSAPILVMFVFLVLPFLIINYFRDGISNRILFLFHITGLIIVATAILINFYGFFQELSATNYPGGRRSRGGEIGPTGFKHSPFSGSISYLFQFFPSDNPSEFASVGIATIFPLMIFFTMRLFLSKIDLTIKYSFAFMFAFVSSCFFWIYKNPEWPFPLSFVFQFTSEGRLTQIVTFLLLFPFILLISNLNLVVNGKLQIVLFYLLLFITIYVSIKSSLSLNSVVLNVNSNIIIVSVLLITILTFILTQFPNRYLMLGFLIIYSFISSFYINPVQIGAGSLSDSKIILFMKQNLKRDVRWAGDNFTSIPLISASGVKALSGVQNDGPNLEAWKILDRDLVYKQYWNSGAGYVLFDWTETDIEKVSISGSKTDVIIIKVNPCNKILDRLELGWVLSYSKLSNSCLSLKLESPWKGPILNIYSRT